MYDRSMRREAKRKDIVEKSISEDGITGEGETALRASMNNGSSSPGKQLENEANEANAAKTKINIFENAFHKIKEATGVSDVNEVIQKIIGQEGTTENLMMLTKENQARLGGLTEETKELKKNVEEMKYSSNGGGHRRKLVEDQEEQFQTSTNRLDRHKVKYER